MMAGVGATQLLRSCSKRSRFVFTPAFATSITLIYSGRLLSFSLISGDPKQNLTELFEKQFRTFASKEFQGVLYMTPDDFVFSVINERLPTRHLQSVSENELERILDKTPEKALRQPTLFRFLGNQPKSGFEIAFKVLDVDSSGTIELAEFSQLNKVASVEFKRAIKACTDEELGEGILETVFCLFDENGDGFISPTEFMVLLKNRKLRGLSKSTFLQKDRPPSLKRCIRKQIEEQS
ncbi:Calcium uptake protein 3, mitochondrial [Sparganum proliferum]